MKVAPLILSAVIAAGSANAAMAAMSVDMSDGTAVLNGSNVDEVLAIARSYGDAELETQSNGDPQIRGTIDGIGYSIYFRNCTSNEDCEDLNFYCGILDQKASPDVINDWNQTTRFGKGYLDEDGDTVVEMDVNLEGGVTVDNLSSTMGVWQIILNRFTEHVGFDPDASN